MRADEQDAASRIRRRAALFDRLCFYIGYAAICTVVIACVTELMSMAVVGVYHGAYARLSRLAPGVAAPETDHRFFSLRNRVIDDARRASGVYAGQPWAEAFLAETGEVQSHWRQRYEPFRVWGSRVVRGTYINTEAFPTGIWRRTTDACAGDGKAIRIWAMGASVMESLDNPDFATIPSYLSRALKAAGRCVEVINMSAGGYVINQQAVLLQDLLKRGFRPDTVVVLGGANEIGVGVYAPRLPWAHVGVYDISYQLDHPMRLGAILARSYAFEVVQAAANRLGLPRAVGATEEGDQFFVDLSASGLRQHAAAILDNYEATIDLMQVLARAYHFDLHVFWQPFIYVGRPHPTPFERMLLYHPLFNPDPDEGRVIAAVYEEAERRARVHGRLFFLGRVFEDVAEPVYIDGLHVGPRGNEIMAGAIALSLHDR